MIVNLFYAYNDSQSQPDVVCNTTHKRQFVLKKGKIIDECCSYPCTPSHNRYDVLQEDITLIMHTNYILFKNISPPRFVHRKQYNIHHSFPFICLEHSLSLLFLSCDVRHYYWCVYLIHVLME
eukprot:122175_1